MLERATPDRTRLTPYQWKLFGFLSVASFFEGYDFFAIAQILPNLRAHFDLSQGQGGILIGAVNAGTIVAYVLVRKADAWGRKRMLVVTIAGYTVFTLASAFAWDAISFGAFQFLARIFLIAEWATSMVYAAEEFPADRRGMVIGVIQAVNSVGAIVCAGVVPLLIGSPWGWRTVYLVAVVPLILLAIWRRGLRESRRFEELGRPAETSRSLFAILSSPYRSRVLQLALIWLLTYVCTQTGITFWKEFAMAERGMTDGDVGRSITIAAVAAMPLTFFAGKLLDVVGRRRGAVVVFIVLSLSIFAAYNLETQAELTVALAFGIFGATAVLPVLNAFTAELFPTELRGDAFAWANNLLGRIGYVAAPTAVGLAAADIGWGRAVSFTTFWPLVALVLILVWLPETKGKELEETAVA